MKGPRAPTQEQAGTLIAMAAVMFGGWVRLLIPWIAGFPINDGGLFYVMLRTLQANGMRIPAYVHYNGHSIPFAYPPFGFYAGAIVANVFRMDAIRVLQWLPAVVLIIALPAFHWLARVVLGTSFRAGIATLMFAFTPRAITWQIMGGGLTRSFGQLFTLLALAAIYLTFDRYSRKWLVLSILFSSLVVLSHPEAALQTVGIAVLFWIFKGRSGQGALHALTIGAGTLIISAVWWLPVVLTYGLSTLLAAGQTGLHSLTALLTPFLLNFVEEPLMSLVAVFGMIGFAAEAARRQWLIPLWLFVPFLVEPRSAPTTTMIPLALLAGIGLADVVLPGLTALSASVLGGNPLRSRATSFMLLFVGVYMFGQTSLFGVQLAGTRISAPTREAFRWIESNTPADSRFLVLSGNADVELFCDAPAEWFSAVAQRVSLTTAQGMEWLPGGQFARTAAAAQDIEGCLDASSPLQCVEDAVSSHPGLQGFQYLYVARTMPVLDACRTVGATARGEQLIDELKQSPRYSEAYENVEAAVFEKR